MVVRKAATHTMTGLAIRPRPNRRQSPAVSVPASSPPKPTKEPEATRVKNPDDEDSLFVSDTEGNNTNSAETPTEPRARNPNGLIDDTICNSGVFNQHPYHHLLNCGHTVVTEKIEPCARTCKHISASGRSNKPEIQTQALDLACPNCYRMKRRAESKLAIPKPIPVRSCSLSHVYGHDKKADDARERARAAHDEAFANQTSPYPDTTSRAVSPEVQEIGRKLVNDKPLFVIKLEKDLEPDLFQLQESYRKLRDATGVRMITQEEIDRDVQEAKENRAVRKLKRLRVDGPSTLPARQPAWQKDRKNRDDRDEDQTIETPDSALQEYENDRIAWYRRADPVDEGNYADPERHCLCDSFDDGYMITCGGCDRMFHKGCIGLGKWHHSEYSVDNPAHREECFKADMEDHLRRGKNFSCKDCLKGQQGGHRDSRPRRFDLTIRRKQPTTESRIAVAARIKMEKAYHVHPSQADLDGDTVQSKRERRQKAHEEASKLAARQMAAAKAPSVDRPATRALQRRVGGAALRKA